MLTDAEVDSLALRILNRALKEIHLLAPLHSLITASETGAPCIELFGTSKEGLGGLRLLYSPLEPIKLLIRESENLFDTFALDLIDKNTGNTSQVNLNDYIPQHKNRAIEFVSEYASLLLVGSLFPRMSELIRDEFADHQMFAKAILAEWLVTCFESDEHFHGKTDMRADLDHAVTTMAEVKRNSLRERLRGLPNIVAQRGRGAPVKTEFKRQLERDQFLADIKSAYHRLTTQQGKPPNKTDVARALGIGGDPKRGGQSALQVFSAKLKRYEIDYKELARKIERELDK